MSNTRARQTGNFYMPGESKLEIPTNPFSEGAAQVKQDKAAKELAERLKEAHEAKQREIEGRLEGLEVIPNANRIIIMPYPENPYVKIMTESGIYLDHSGAFKNPDSGTMDNLQEVIKCAKVIEVGPDCKRVVNGDDVYYDSRTVYPLPFMSLGYMITTEIQLLAVVNNDLKKRWGMNDGE